MRSKLCNHSLTSECIQKFNAFNDWNVDDFKAFAFPKWERLTAPTSRLQATSADWLFYRYHHGCIKTVYCINVEKEMPKAKMSKDWRGKWRHFFDIFIFDVFTVKQTCVEGEEFLRCRMDLPSLKKFRNKCTEFVSDSADSCKILKIFSLDTALAKKIFFLECTLFMMSRGVTMYFEVAKLYCSAHLLRTAKSMKYTGFYFLSIQQLCLYGFSPNSSSRSGLLLKFPSSYDFTFSLAWWLCFDFFKTLLHCLNWKKSLRLLFLPRLFPRHFQLIIQKIP